MAKQREITFGNSAKCTLDLEAGYVKPEPADPDHTLTAYPVLGLGHGRLEIVVTRTGAPAIVRVEATDHESQLSRADIEQIRSNAERIIRSELG